MDISNELMRMAKEARSSEEIIVIAKKNGKDISKEESERLFSLMHKYDSQPAGELSDDELDNVAGGGHCESDMDYASGDTPLYQKGQVVYYKPTSISVRRIKAEITFVHPEKSGVRNKEFVYDVIIASSGEVQTDVYESQIVM